jgi:hypothetical protein
MEPNYDNALAILNSVKDRVKWNGEESFYPTGLKDALKKSLGNSADINYLAINALKSADFTAFPVIMRTRNNGILPWYPTVDAFNYVITGLIIDGTSYYTDASVKYSTWNLLPQKCMVTQARLMLGEGQCQWADLSLLSEGQDMTMAYSSFEGNSLVRKVERTLNGNDALTFRSQYYSLSDKSKLTDLLASKMDMQIEDMQINGLDSYSEPVALSFTGKTEVDLTDDILYINPSVDRVISGNPFKDEVRLYPVQFPCKESFIVLNTIQIPAGYEIEELPKAERILFGEGDIVFTHGITATGESIQMQHVYQMKRIQYLPEEYDDLRDFFGKIIAKYDELIVLKKKTVD